MNFIDTGIREHSLGHEKTMAIEEHTGKIVFIEDSNEGFVHAEIKGKKNLNNYEVIPIKGAHKSKEDNKVEVLGYENLNKMYVPFVSK